MKRNLSILLIIVFSSLGFSEDSNVNESKVICVVSGEVIEGDYKEESAKYKEGEVYFCCGGCKMDFEEDASKFSTTSNFQLLATKQYSETNVCPVSGRKIKNKKEVTIEGISIALCCAGCVLVVAWAMASMVAALRRRRCRAWAGRLLFSSHALLRNPQRGVRRQRREGRRGWGARWRRRQGRRRRG